MTRWTRVRAALAVLGALALVTTGLMAPAQAAGPGTVNGKISVSPGLTLTGSVALYRWSAGSGRWDYVSQTMVGPDGSYSLTGASAGDDLTLVYYPPGNVSIGYAPMQMLGGHFPREWVKVPAQVFKGTGGAQTKNFPLVDGVPVTGRVALPSGVAGPVRVALYVQSLIRYGGVVAHDGARRVDEVEVTVPAGGTGTFTFPRVLPGEKYSVAVRGAEPGYSLEHEPQSLVPPYDPASSAAMRTITGPTTLPTLTLRKSVPVSGRVIHPYGESWAGRYATLYRRDPAGRTGEVAAVLLAADGSFSFPAGAFPGYEYTVRVEDSWYSLPGKAMDLQGALWYRAGQGALTIPTFEAVDPIGPESDGSIPYVNMLVSGAPVVGSTLSLRRDNGQVGAFHDIPGVSYEYRWLRDGEFIAGQTRPTYTVTREDLGHYLSARVVVRAPDHIAHVIYTAAFVPTEGAAPRATTHPVVSGTVKVGKKLSVSKGSWSVPGTSVAFQWLREGKEIAGARGASYVLGAADLGKRISVRVTASAPGYETGVSVTAPTAKVAKGDAPKATKKPKITGTVRVGKKLKVSKGTWSLPGVKVSYQWLRGGKKIAKATKATYKLTAKDKGKKISVRVSAKKTGYKTGTVVTKATKKVKAKR